MAPVLSSLFSLLKPRSRAAASVKTVVARFAAFRQARANRRAFAQLAGWDDHMLADIGLNRTTVDGALAASFAVDPSQIVSKDRARVSAGSKDLPASRRPDPMPAGCWAY